MKSIILVILCFNAVLTAPMNIDNDLDHDEHTLRSAAEKGDVKTVRKLIESGTSIHSVDENGGTSLHRAAHAGKEKIVQVLLDNGADVNSQDGIGHTPLHKSVLKGHEATVNILIHNDADVNLADKNGSTPLHAAFKEGHTKIIQSLIENGADMTIRNNANESVLEYAMDDVTNGLTTIWFGASALVQRTIHIIKDPLAALYKTKLKTVGIGPVIMSFGDEKDHSHETKSTKTSQNQSMALPSTQIHLDFRRNRLY